MAVATGIACVSAQTPDVEAVRQKAQAGNAEAEYQLARAYYSGKGVPFDPKQGLQWLRKSASQNYSAAEYALGVMFQLGDQSVSQNPHEAASWFRKAAQQKNLDARTRLAAMLAQGLITKQEADWRSVAAERAQKQQKVEAQTQQPPPQSPPAFSFAEVETGLAGGITNKRLAALIATYGVDFALDDTNRQKLTADGADDTLLAVISTSKRPL